MPRRSKLEQNSEARAEAVRMWREGKNLDEISENISLQFPDAPSRSGVHRFIQKIRPFLQLQEAGFFSNEDLDLLTQSQNLASIANGLLIQCLVSWQESQEIDQEQLKGLLNLVNSAAKMSSSAAGVEKTKTQLSRHYEGLMDKVAAAASRALPNEEARDKLMAELSHEMKNG